MKCGLWVVMLAMSGCATVADIEKTPPTMSVISGKKPDEFSKCVLAQLDDGRAPSVVEPYDKGLRMVVSQRHTSNPAGIIQIEPRSGGSSIRVYEAMANSPLRPREVQHAATHCISGK